MPSYQGVQQQFPICWTNGRSPFDLNKLAEGFRAPRSPTSWFFMDLVGVIFWGYFSCMTSSVMHAHAKASNAVARGWSLEDGNGGCMDVGQWLPTRPDRDGNSVVTVQAEIRPKNRHHSCSDKNYRITSKDCSGQWVRKWRGLRWGCGWLAEICYIRWGTQSLDLNPWVKNNGDEIVTPFHRINFRKRPKCLRTCAWAVDERQGRAAFVKDIIKTATVSQLTHITH